MNFESGRGVAVFVMTRESERYVALVESAARSRDRESSAGRLSDEQSWLAGLVPEIQRRSPRPRCRPQIRGGQSSPGLLAPVGRTRPPPRLRISRATGHSAN